MSTERQNAPYRSVYLKGCGEVLLAEARLIEIIISSMKKIKRKHTHNRSEPVRTSQFKKRKGTLWENDNHKEINEGSNSLPLYDERKSSNRQLWIFGYHAVVAALRNQRRRIFRILTTTEGAERIMKTIPDSLPEIVNRKTIEQLLPKGAVHQGIALLVSPIEPMPLDQLLLNTDENTVVLILDQVTDPQNIGAAARNAAAFGAKALILTDRYSTSAEATLMKTASGALEILPLVRVANLARTLVKLKNAGYWCIGLADDAQKSIGSTPLDGRIALIMGSEGRGLRHLTRSHCDMLLSLPTKAPITAINIAAATAVVLYEITRWQKNTLD